MIIEKKELISVVGGTKITAALLNTAVRGISLILELGRSVGTAIRRFQTGRLC